MFKVISGRTYNAIMEETKTIKADILVLQQNREADKLKIAEQQEELVVRGNRISLLVSQNDACKSMREDLKKKYDQAITDLSAVRSKEQQSSVERRELKRQIESLKADLRKQGNELVVKSDELKLAKRSIASLEATNKTNEELSACYSDAQSKNAILNIAIGSAMAEMRKVNRGKPSHNKSRAFQILERGLADAMPGVPEQAPTTNEA